MVDDGSPSRLPAAWRSTLLLFFVHGLIVATWVSRIPAVKQQLHLGNAALGFALLGVAVGSLVTTPIAGWLVTRYGNRRLIILSSLGFCVALILPALAFNFFTIFLALACFGSTAAVMNVSMNTHAVIVEERWHTPTMSRFHAMFSVGGMAGAALGGVVAAQGITPLPHFFGTALLFAGMTWMAVPYLLSGQKAPTKPAHQKLSIRRVPLAIISLSLIGFCVLIGEGAMADWTAVYLSSSLHTGPGTAAAGYAVFSTAMAIGRLAGDFTTARLGRMRVVRDGTLLAAFGLGAALLIGTVPMTFLGFAAAGAGFAAVVPIVYGSAGRVSSLPSGAGLAFVAGVGYIGFLIGPPMIGMTAGLVSLRVALGILVVLSLLAALLSKSLAEADAPAQPVLAEAHCDSSTPLL